MSAASLSVGHHAVGPVRGVPFYHGLGAGARRSPSAPVLSGPHLDGRGLGGDAHLLLLVLDVPGRGLVVATLQGRGYKI